MSYQALARKWRPRRFSEIAGQSHVVRALRNALIHDRVHHAYLFTGTRGVGKTTIARILAKALNCGRLDDGEPCGRCDVCVAVDEGRFADLIEVDAASRTRVEDTRELLENAQYAPSSGRYKIYLIDEVHMLSGHSFNALLKTLEEPPPHVKFLLATTDPQKIPVTVLSRCLQFNLTKLPQSRIQDHLGRILKAESIAFEEEGLKLLARSADGSLRDALSLLDQAIVYGGGEVRAKEVAAMLGGVVLHSLRGVVEALATGDAALVMHEARRLFADAADPAEILTGLLGLLHRIALAQQLPETASQDEDGAWVVAQARAMIPEDVQLFYQIGLMGRKDLPWAPDPATGLEMVLLRMLAFRPLEAGGEGVSDRGAGGGRRPVQIQGEPSSRPGPALDEDRREAVIPDAAGSAENGMEPWSSLVARMKLPGMARELAHHCVLEKLEDDRCVLILDQSFEHLLSERLQARLAQALVECLKRPLRLEIRTGSVDRETPADQHQRRQAERQARAEQEIAEDETVKAIMETFDAKVVPGTIRPVEDGE